MVSKKWEARHCGAQVEGVLYLAIVRETLLILLCGAHRTVDIYLYLEALMAPFDYMVPEI